LAHAAVELAQGRLEEAAAQLALAKSHVQSTPPARRRRLAVAIASLRLALARRSGQFTEVMEQVNLLDASTADESSDQIPMGSELRAVALMNLGIVETWSGRFDDAERHLSEGAALAQTIGRPYLEVACRAHQGFPSKLVSVTTARERGRQAVGRRAVPFGMRILYTARNRRPDFERESGAVRVELPRLFKESDVLSLHVPSVPETKGIINADTLRQMKPGAILINTARGDLVREEALAQALEEGRLGGAGLDVYLEEPAVHARLRAAPRAVLLPHIGSATFETRRQMATIAVANVQAVLKGDPPLTPVFG